MSESPNDGESPSDNSSYSKKKYQSTTQKNQGESPSDSGESPTNYRKNTKPVTPPKPNKRFKY